MPFGDSTSKEQTDSSAGSRAAKKNAAKFSVTYYLNKQPSQPAPLERATVGEQ
jgi:hypothetical protein